MASLRSVHKTLWTPIDLSANVERRHWTLGLGWLLFGLGMFSAKDPGLSVNLFKLAGYFITFGTLEQRIEARLWPFYRRFERAERLLAAVHRIANTPLTGVGGCLTIVFLSLICLGVLVGWIIGL
jgi:hypothetical protein